MPRVSALSLTISFDARGSAVLAFLQRPKRVGMALRRVVLPFKS